MIIENASNLFLLIRTVSKVFALMDDRVADIDTCQPVSFISRGAEENHPSVFHFNEILIDHPGGFRSDN